METRQPIASILLCAGESSRMRCPHIQKVCLPIGEKPAVVNTLDKFNDLGIDTNILVVGHQAQVVMEAVGSCSPDVAYVYQEMRLGTAHAARLGSSLLKTVGFEGAVLVSTGDKSIEPSALEKLVLTHGIPPPMRSRSHLGA